MNDEQFFLANAYLDGELTADERAVAESDPAVMAEVEELRTLQARLRDVEPPSDAARESAIAAAMAEFQPAAATPPRRAAEPPAPLPFRSRPSYTKYLALAAGVLGVGLVGVAVANLDTGGDDDDMAMEPAAEEPAAEEPAAEEDVMSAESMDAPADAPMMDGAEEPAEEPAEAADEPASEPAAEAPVEEPAAEEPAAEEPASEPESDRSGERPELVPGQVLTTPEELGAYGTGLLEQEQAGTLGSTPNTSCPIDDVLGTAEYEVAGTVVPVLVAVDEPAGLVLAFGDESCEYVAQGPLYLP